MKTTMTMTEDQIIKDGVVYKKKTDSDPINLNGFNRLRKRNPRDKGEVMSIVNCAAKYLKERYEVRGFARGSMIAEIIGERLGIELTNAEISYILNNNPHKHIGKYKNDVWIYNS